MSKKLKLTREEGLEASQAIKEIKAAITGLRASREEAVALFSEATDALAAAYGKLSDLIEAERAEVEELAGRLG